MYVTTCTLVIIKAGAKGKKNKKKPCAVGCGADKYSPGPAKSLTVPCSFCFSCRFVSYYVCVFTDKDRRVMSMIAIGEESYYGMADQRRHSQACGGGGGEGEGAWRILQLSTSSNRARILPNSSPIAGMCPE